jgi:hypothetical protein
MKQLGMNNLVISQVTGLTEAEIAEL